MEGKMYPGIKKIHCCFFTILHKTSFSFGTTSRILSGRSPRTPSFPSVTRERGPKYATCPRSDNLPMAIGWGRGWCQLESSSIYSPDTSVKFYFCPGFWSPDVMSSWLEPQWRPINPGSPLGPRRGPSRAGAATCRFLARPSPGLHTFKMTHWLGWESIP